MSIGIKVKVWGDYALFCRPEMKTERCSYDVMTPSAARGNFRCNFLAPWVKMEDRSDLCESPDSIYQYTSE